MFKSLTTLKGQKIDVGTMYCLGQNYEDHIREMKSDKQKEPVVFLKPPAAFIPNKENVILPSFSENVHHEVEMVLIIKEDVECICPENALKCIGGIGVGIDMTLRDIQKQAKEEGKPWTQAKGFRTSAPISDILDYDDADIDLENLDIMLMVNEELRQKSNTENMIMKVPELISYLSNIFSLRAGDVIFTGTPEGVGPVKNGDTIYAELSSKGKKLTSVEVYASDV